MSGLCALLLIPLLLLHQVISISFYLPLNSRKCLFENIPPDVLVSGDYEVYEVSEHPEIVTNLKITDARAETLFAKDNVTKGKFSFATDEHDQFEVCFSSTSPTGGTVPEQLIKLNMKHGVEAKNYKDIEKVEKLSPLEAQLQFLELLSQAISDGFTTMIKHDKEKAQTNSSTNRRVQLFSIFSVGCFLSLATWQIFYLKRFFRTMKLIE